MAESDLFIEIKNKEGFASESNGMVTVILDTTLTSELIEMGNVREIISKIQNLRKDSNLEVTDHILLQINSTPEVMQMVNKNKQAIEKETLSTLTYAKIKLPHTTTFDLQQSLVTICVDKQN